MHSKLFSLTKFKSLSNNINDIIKQLNFLFRVNYIFIIYFKVIFSLNWQPKITLDYSSGLLKKREREHYLEFPTETFLQRKI